DIPLNEARQLRILINSPSKETHNIEYVLSHQKVIEGIHKAGYVVVPIRFGSILTRENTLKLLSEGYAYFVQKLQTLQGKDEYGVILVAGKETERKVSAKIMQNIEVKRVADKMHTERSTGKEGAYYFSELKLGDLVRNLRFKLFDEMAKESNRLLSALAPISIPQKGTLSGTIFNRAYLVDRSKIIEFNNALEIIRQRFSPLDVKIFKSGPWAAYSFSIDDRFSRNQLP